MRILITLLLLGLPLGVYAERIEQSLEADLHGKLDIEIMDGMVELIGWDKPMVQIQGEISGKIDNFVFERKGNTISIELTGKHGYWGHRKDDKVDITINAPRQSQVRADGHSVSFDFKNLVNSVRANTMSGDIELAGGNGRIDLESVSGDVVVNGASGRLNLSSVSGDIDANASATNFDARSVSGAIEASIGMAERVELETVSGDIDVRLGLADNARLDADTVSGDIDLHLENQKLNASFDIETGPGGDIKNRLSDDDPSSRSIFSGSLEFRLGDGNSTVKLETMSGTIKLDN